MLFNEDIRYGFQITQLNRKDRMTQQLKVSQFVSQTKWTAIPDKVREKVKMCFVDNLGATLAGTRTPVSRICSDFAETLLPGTDATVFLRELKTSAIGAAFANGAAANGVDTDDSARYAWGHAGAQIFPTAFAMAESLGRGGEQLLTSMIVGYEVAHRMGRCWHDDHDVYQACGSWGAAACAATAANLLQLSPEQCRHALGIADYHASNAPMMRDVVQPAMVKHGIAWACVTGICAAQLAKRGFTGIPSLLEAPKYRDWVMDIGDTYIMLEGVSWKEKGLACCGWAHPAAKGARELIEAHRFDVSEIRAIEVETFEEATHLFSGLPETTEEAQFSIAWPVAAMLMDGQVGPQQTSENRLKDPAVRDLARKVTISVNPEFDEFCRLHAKGDPKGGFFGRVHMVLENGRKFKSSVQEAGLSFTDHGWNREKMTDKFRWLTHGLISAEDADSLLEAAWDIDRLNRLDELVRLIR